MKGGGRVEAPFFGEAVPEPSSPRVTRRVLWGAGALLVAGLLVPNAVTYTQGERVATEVAVSALRAGTGAVAAEASCIQATRYATVDTTAFQVATLAALTGARDSGPTCVSGHLHVPMAFGPSAFVNARVQYEGRAVAITVGLRQGGLSGNRELVPVVNASTVVPVAYTIFGLFPVRGEIVGKAFGASPRWPVRRRADLLVR